MAANLIAGRPVLWERSGECRRADLAAELDAASEAARNALRSAGIKEVFIERRSGEVEQHHHGDLCSWVVRAAAL